MDFKTFYRDLSARERDDLASSAKTTRGYLDQIAYANKKIELGVADVLVSLSNKKLSIEDMPLTERAAAQHETRIKKHPWPLKQEN